MLFGVTTVLGYMGGLAAVGFTIMYFIKKDVRSHDSETIDPMPEERY